MIRQIKQKQWSKNKKQNVVLLKQTYTSSVKPYGRGKLSWTTWWFILQWLQAQGLLSTTSAICVVGNC